MERWLVAEGVRDIRSSRRTSRFSLFGTSPFGETTLKLAGVTPTSLYSTGELAPLVLRVEFGSRPEVLDALAAESIDGVLWQASSASRYRAVALSGLEPLSPLNRLTPQMVERFLRWAHQFLSPDDGRVARAASQACRSAVEAMSLWERVNLSWKATFGDHRDADLELRRKAGRSIRGSNVFDTVVDWPGGQHGPIALIGRYRGTREEGALELEVDLFRVDRPRAREPVAHVGSLEQLAELVAGDLTVTVLVEAVEEPLLSSRRCVSIALSDQSVDLGDKLAFARHGLPPSGERSREIVARRRARALGQEMSASAAKPPKMTKKDRFLLIISTPTLIASLNITMLNKPRGGMAAQTRESYASCD